ASPVFSDDGTLLAAPLLPESITETYSLTQPDTATPGNVQEGGISHRRPHTSIIASHENNLLYLSERGRSSREHSTFVLPFQIRESQPLTSSKLLLVSTSGEPRLFDSKTEELVTLGTDALSTTDFDLHIGSDTTKVILTSERGFVILHDTASATTTQLQLRAPTIGISFSPDGTSAVCADRTGTIHLLSCASLTLEHKSQIVLPIQTEITSIEHSPDGNTVLLTCGDEGRNVQTFDAKTLSHIATTTLTKPGKAVWISNEDVVVASDLGLYRWQRQGSGESLTQVRTAAVRSITSSGPRLAWVEKESLQYTVPSNSAVSPHPLRNTETFSAFSMDTSTEIVVKHQTSSLPLSVHFDHAGQTLQVSGYTHSYRICRTSDMTQLESPKTLHATPTILMRFLPDSHTLLLVSSDGTCSTWTPEDGSKTQNNTLRTSLISATVSSQRTHLLTVDSGNQGRVYQLPNCTEIPIPGLEKNVTQLAISSDNQNLYALFTNGELRQTRIAPEIVPQESRLVTAGVVSAQPFPANPRLLLITRSTNTGGPLSLALLDTETGTETAIGDSLNSVKASVAPSGDQILLLTDDQRFLKLKLEESDGEWTVPDDSVAELATGVLHFNCPAESPFAIVFRRDETEFLSLQDSSSVFVIPFSGTLANESTAKWDKASSSQNGLWFAVTGKKLECWPAELQHYVESNAGRQLTAAERKRYAIRDDLKNSNR
ncbi:MAG: WD40 repeat domain-containing protein, partial [Planctomycetaceae bacterium]